jgi:hypothetical protein
LKIIADSRFALLPLTKKSSHRSTDVLMHTVPTGATEDSSEESTVCELLLILVYILGKNRL